MSCLELRTLICAAVTSVLLICLPATRTSIYSQNEPSGTSGRDRSIGSSDSPETLREEMPVLLRGRVLKEDGTPTGQLLQVELVCAGRTRQQTQLDGRGFFSFRVGARETRSDWADASVSTNGAGTTDFKKIDRMGSTRSAVGAFGMDRADLTGCEIRVFPRAGYTADSIRLGMRGAFDDPDVGTILLRRTDGEAGTVVSLTRLAAPKEAQEAYDKAQKELGKKKVNHSRVERELAKAVKIYPEFASAWHLLGQARVALNDLEGGQEAFQQAIRADERFIDPYIDLARMALQEQEWQRASELTDKLLDLSPNMPHALFFNGLAKYSVGNLRDAEKSLRRLDERGLSAEYPLTYFYLGVIDAQHGEIQRAAAEFRSYLASTPQAQVPEQWRKEITSQLARWQAQGLIGSL